MKLSELRNFLEEIEVDNGDLDVIVYDTNQQEYCEPLVGLLRRDGKYCIDITCGEPI